VRKWKTVVWFSKRASASFAPAVWRREHPINGEQKLVNGNGEAERWYRQLLVPSRIGLEATGNSQWFVELLQKLGHEVCANYIDTDNS
jgi:hypothetical protein